MKKCRKKLKNTTCWLQVNRKLISLVSKTYADKTEAEKWKLQYHISSLAQRLSLFVHIAWMTSKTDAKILTSSQLRTGDHQDALILRGWRLSSKIWNPITSPRIKWLTWLRIIHSVLWCLHLVLCTPSGACQKKNKKKNSEVAADRIQ